MLTVWPIPRHRTLRQLPTSRRPPPSPARPLRVAHAAESSRRLLPPSRRRRRPHPRPSVSPAAPTITAPPADYSAAGVPSLDFVRDKIEGRYATAQGATELAESVIPEVKDAQEQAAAREKAAQEKLAEIRRSLRGGGQP